MFVERCTEASTKLLLSLLPSMTQMRNITYSKIANTFIVCWGNFKRTLAKQTRMFAYLGMEGGEMRIKGNK